MCQGNLGLMVLVLEGQQGGVLKLNCCVSIRTEEMDAAGQSQHQELSVFTQVIRQFDLITPRAE